jgi:hypothetical protein
MVFKNMKKIHYITYVLLSITLIYACFHMSSERFLLNMILIFLSLFFVFGLYKVFLETKEINSITLNKKLLYDFVWTFLGAYFTYALSLSMNMNVVIASALIGILGHFFIKKHEIAIYCGSFAGMTSVFLLSPIQMVFLSFLCATLYIFSTQLFKGLGGKLGTIAFASGLLTFLVFNINYESSTLIYIPLTHFILISILGMASAFYMQHKFKQTATFASASTSLLFALIIIPLSPIGSTFALLFFAASFAGMSSQNTIKTPIFVILTGVIVGLIFYLLNTELNGVGGKLGTIALIATTTVYGISLVYESIKKYLIIKKSITP